MRRDGFTLIEMVVYLGLAALVLGSLVGITMQLIQDQADAQQRSELLYARNHIVHTVVFYGRRARSIDGTVFGDPGTLVLGFDNHPTLTVSRVLDEVVLGSGVTSSIARLQIQEDGGDVDWLTAEYVHVDQFAISDQSDATTTAFAVEIGVLPAATSTLAIPASRGKTTVTLYE